MRPAWPGRVPGPRGTTATPTLAGWPLAGTLGPAGGRAWPTARWTARPSSRGGPAAPTLAAATSPLSARSCRGAAGTASKAAALGAVSWAEGPGVADVVLLLDGLM